MTTFIKNRNQFRYKLLLAIVLLLTMSLLGGCAPKAPVALDEPVRIAALKGPTGMGLVYLMGGPDGEKPYDIALYGAPDEIVGKIVSGEVDMAAVPTNLAAALYQKTNGAVRYIATNTLGVLYVMTTDPSIDSFEALRGKTIGLSGQGSTAEFIFRHLLKENGLDPDKDVVIDFSLQHAELMTLLTAGKVDIAVLPQPFVTSAQMASEKVLVALDLNQEWIKVHGEAVLLPMGGMIARTEYLEAHPEALERFLSDYEASVKLVNSDPKAASVLMETYQILPKAAVAERAIPLSNIVFYNAEESKMFLTTFFEILLQYDPKTIGGALPGEDFFAPLN
jgi:NitT/TauT family transport system substrate-binding protein